MAKALEGIGFAAPLRGRGRAVGRAPQRRWPPKPGRRAGIYAGIPNWEHPADDVRHDHRGRHGELTSQEVRAITRMSRGNEQREESNGILATCPRGAGEPRVRSEHGSSEPYERWTGTER